MEEQSSDFKVRLTSARPNDTPVAQRAAAVVFDVSPEVSENRNISYKNFDPEHAPGQIHTYQSTNSRTFQLSGCKLISRTSEEASLNLARLWTIRSWGMPNFGVSERKNGINAAETEIQKDNKTTAQRSVREMIREMSGQTVPRNFLGAPPAVLYLSAYSRFTVKKDGKGSASVGHLHNIPVVITQLSIGYPIEVDYIPTAESDPTPMPTIMTVDIQLTETQSPAAYEQFSLQQFRTGDLSGF